MFNCVMWFHDFFFFNLLIFMFLMFFYVFYFLVFWPLSWIVTCWIVTLVSWMSTVWYLYMYVSGTYPWTTYIDPIYVQILSYVFASSSLTCFSAFNVPDVRKTWVSFCVACSTSVSHAFHVERSEHQGSASLVFGTFRLLGGAYALLHGLLLPLHPLGGISVSQKREKVQPIGLPWEDWYIYLHGSHSNSPKMYVFIYQSHGLYGFGEPPNLPRLYR